MAGRDARSRGKDSPLLLKCNKDAPGNFYLKTIIYLTGVGLTSIIDLTVVLSGVSFDIFCQKASFICRAINSICLRKFDSRPKFYIHTCSF